MSDREKVINSIKYCINHPLCIDCDACNYGGESSVICDRLIQDALALLKDPDRIKVTRCKDCRYFEPSNAEEGDCSGYCRNDYVPCQNQTVDAWWFCGSAERVSE